MGVVSVKEAIEYLSDLLIALCVQSYHVTFLIVAHLLDGVILLIICYFSCETIWQINTNPCTKRHHYAMTNIIKYAYLLFFYCSLLPSPDEMQISLAH